MSYLMCLSHYFLITEPLFRGVSFRPLIIKGILGNLHGLPGLTPGQLKFGKISAISHMQVFSRFWNYFSSISDLWHYQGKDVNNANNERY